MLDLILDTSTLKAVAFGLAIGLLTFWLVRRKRYRLPPGPFPLPLLGNVLQFKTEHYHEQFYQWSLKYGPVISVHLGPKLCVVVNDQETANEVLVKRGADFSGRMKSPSLDFVSDGGKNIMFAQDGPTLRFHRKIAAKAFRHYLQGDVLQEKIHHAISVVIDELRSQTEPTDPECYITFIVGFIIMGVSFNINYKYNDPELIKLFEAIDKMFAVIPGGFPEEKIPGMLYIWESQRRQQMRKNCTFILDFVKKQFDKHCKTFDRDNPRDISDTLLLARLEAEEDPTEANLEKLTDAHIIQTLADILFGGTETTRLVLRYLILHMAAYPDIQTKVQEEIDCVVGRKELPGMKHRSKLTYTEASIYESIRLSSVTPVGLPHRANCDTSISGYDVPKDTMIMVNLWALHHDPTQWQDVNDFRPERFLDQEGNLRQKPDNYLPFSAGRRVCLGEPVAKAEFVLILACLMQKFTWRLHDGVKANLSPDRSVFGIVPKPHKLIIEKRL